MSRLNPEWQCVARKRDKEKAKKLASAYRKDGYHARVRPFGTAGLITGNYTGWKVYIKPKVQKAD